ncbi:MAG: zinc-dependent metalloprotease [Flavobacteriales bacterium]
MKNLMILALTSVLGLGVSTHCNAQLFKKKKKDKTEEAPKPKEKSDIKSIEDLTEKCVKMEGLFTMYQDSTSGTTFMEISEDQLGKEFIYFSYIENGVVDAGAFRGNYRQSKIFKINKYYDNIEFELVNTRYYFDEDNNISKASEANINTPVVLSLKIKGQDEDKTKYVISAEDVFMAETFSRIKPVYPPTWKGFKLGKMSKEKSRTESIRNYPENTDVRVKMAFENSGRGSFGSGSLTDGRFVNIVYHQSLIAVPENDFDPRRDDPRVGYFMTGVTDLTTADVTPYRDMIHRWHLVKKDPSAAVSEPVEPITWWIENTTPEELRPIIKEGVEQWNMAFEAAGFNNAVVVKVQPDDAEWDAGDIRYNVLRWTSSPIPPFGGYGPSFVNPRTGQILGADVMLEYVYILGRLKSEEIFDIAGLGIENENEEQVLFFGQQDHDHKLCLAGTAMSEQVLFGNAAMAVTDLSDIDKDRFLVESLKRLVLHEVGHTLGLNHNMKGSSIQRVEDLKNMEKMLEEGMCNSVMEYPAINFALNKEEQALFYDSKPGQYDYWVIDYGYSQGLTDSAAEEARLQKILSKSGEPMLVFGNDGDDMRSPGKGIDPLVNIYDLSSDPVAYASDRIMLIEDKLMPNLLEKFSEEGETYMKMRNAYLTLTGQKGRQLVVISKHIGGIHVNRTVEGDKSNTDPYTPYSLEHQKAAMDALSKYAFAPDAWSFDEELIRHLQFQRRGFNQPRGGEDPKLHNRILNTQRALLAHLLHPNLTRRISDSELYGNEYSLSEYMTDLTDAVFKADLNKDVNSVRQNLQLEYTKRLAGYLGNKSALASTKSMALYELNRIKGWSKSRAGNVSTKAHRQHLALIIDKALED